MDVHKSFHLKDARNFHLKVILNHTVRLYCDMHDSWEIDEESLDQCDFYFKRSYNRKKIEHLKKVYPFGFNYEVYPNDMDLFALQRSLFLSTGWKERIIKSLHSLKIVDKYFCPPRLEYLESLPDYHADPKIIFAARLWDPNDDQERPEGEKGDMVYVNKMRVECVRALRKEFQDKFYGGIAPTKFAIENFPDTIIPDFNNSRKRNYLRLLRDFPIVIATTGLHESIGWKWGEYLSMSKAIVSERLHYDVPGDLKEGVNYLVFDSVDEGVKKAKILLENKDIRNSMMSQNFNYYHAYLQPEVIIWNTIMIALGNKV